MALLDYADTIARKVARNKKYIEQEEMRNPDFVRPRKVRNVLREVNAKLHDGDKPISKTTLLRYHKIGLDKRRAVGALPSIPLNLLNCMRLHIKVQQVSKQGQASGNKIKSNLIAAALGTEHEGFDGDWAWRRMRELYPSEVSPSVVSQQESIRNEWTTYTKVNDWYECNKKTLIKSGLAIDTPTTLEDGTIAELTIGEEELRRIVNFDETDHPFTTENDKGGSRSVRWGDLKLGKGTERGTRGSRHTTGIYGSNAAGEAMPPVYCFDSSAANIENYQVKSTWVDGLPKVRGKYGCPTTEDYESFVSVRKSGCTDEQLMQQIIEDVYLPLYPNCQKDTVRVNGKLVAGPIILKTDSGQGRLNASFSSLEFCERMQQRGVYLVLGLPNSTSCTQEQDQLYQEFKMKTRTKTGEIFSAKLYKRSLAIKELKDELRQLGFHEDIREVTDITDEASDQTAIIAADCEVTPAMKVVLDKLKIVMRTPSLSNDDLSLIVNGAPDEPMCMSPFFSTFSKPKILNCFRRVGYAPFTRACLKSTYIRHELGEEREDNTLEDLVQEYEDAKMELKHEGFNVEGIFDAEVPTATKLRRKETEEEQVKALVERKGGFSASAIFTNIGTMCVTSGAIIKAQRLQLEQKALEDMKKTQKKAATTDKRLQEAQYVKEKNTRGEVLSAKDLKSVIKFVLPAVKSSDPPSRYTTKPQITARLSQLDKHWSEYIPARTEVEIATNAEDEEMVPDFDAEEI